MNFETDQQTLNDLNILGKYKPNSVYSLFCQTVTGGGESLLEQMFMNPLTDAGQINERVAEFSWFKQHNIDFPMEEEESEEVEQYLLTGRFKVGVKLLEACKFKVLEMVGYDPRLELWREQILVVIRFLQKVRVCIRSLHPSIKETPLGESVAAARRLLESKEMEMLIQYDTKKRMTARQVFQFDRIILKVLHKELQKLLELVYRLDVGSAVGKIARERHFTFAEICESGDINVKMEQLFHPCLKNAVANDVEISKQKNLFFLTGANMAGKSTLMKSFGIAVYMAHIGFPVAAERMQFQVQQGLYTSINVSDNLNMGYSHFYAEVLRVKKVAIEVSRGKRLVIVFDELFKGTNVKDAYDATFVVTAALAKRENCSLMISTHIIEVATELDKQCDNINFEYLPTIMKGSVPTYTYKLTQGVTCDKHGMIILNNERIVDIILGETRV